MTENRRKKTIRIKRISKLISDYHGLIMFEYHGLSVQDISEIRNEIKEQEAKMIVLKNRLVKLAATKAGFRELEQYLAGPNVFIFLDEEKGLNTIKSIAKFAKKFKAIKIKAGIYEEKVVNADEVNLIATLPSYEEALTILARSLITPLQQVGVGLKMLVDENHIKAE